MLRPNQESVALTSTLTRRRITAVGLVAVAGTLIMRLLLPAPSAGAAPAVFPLAPPGPFTTSFRLAVLRGRPHTVRIKRVVIAASGGLWGPPVASGESWTDASIIGVYCSECISRKNGRATSGDEITIRVPRAKREVEAPWPGSTLVGPRSQITVGADREESGGQTGHAIQLTATRRKVFTLRAVGRNRLELVPTTESCSATPLPESPRPGNEAIWGIAPVAQPCPGVWQTTPVPF
jgi:hypothetical protein